jgi:hypothetical protein
MHKIIKERWKTYLTSIILPKGNDTSCSFYTVVIKCYIKLYIYIVINVQLFPIKLTMFSGVTSKPYKTNIAPATIDFGRPHLGKWKESSTLS